MTKERIEVLKQLNIMFPDAKGELDYNNAFELLVAVVLSAQTTDIAVNVVTKDLFSTYPTPKALAAAKVEDVMGIINKIGLYKVKSKNIINLSQMILNDFKGEVPKTREDLVKLPGVGRKTANVVLSIIFDIPAIAVDTHVNRVSKRLGLAPLDASVLEVEESLMSSFDKEHWQKLHHQLIFFGRYHCKSRNPNCKTCPLVDICVFEDKNL